MSRSSLAPLLGFVLAHRPGLNRLIHDRAAVDLLAQRLPPLPCAGLELRLAAPDATVTDLQLGLRNLADVHRLGQWLQSHERQGGAQPLPAAWAALHQAL